MEEFRIVAGFSPEGDQPRAIAGLVEGIEKGLEHQVLLGVTGSGKTFTIANVIENTQRPSLIIAHNKMTAAGIITTFNDDPITDFCKILSLFTVVI